MFVYYLLMDTESSNKSKIRKRKAALNVSFCIKKEKNTIYQKVSTILLKAVSERSADDVEFLNNSKDIVKQINLRKAQRQKIKDRAQEYEDPSDILKEKCEILAEALKSSNHLVVYTGAGISTAACIPDYRGTNGIWTRMQQGKDIGLYDLSQAEPTLTHMALYCLYRSEILKHVVSQNCDGLHLRSGIPRSTLSEVHGNMYLEVCMKCKPCNHYLRLFDVTEYTARYSHETLRLCYKCGNPLKDTIVHFGERGKLQWPLNWETACNEADKADVILCLGSSLKVLKKYPWLWCMDKPVKKRPKLYIVNLQWTPKDDHSTLKINGKCDTVIKLMMTYLGMDIPKYTRNVDPIFHHATILHELEMHTTNRSSIEKISNVISSNDKPINDHKSSLKNCSNEKQNNERQDGSVFDNSVALGPSSSKNNIFNSEGNNIKDDVIMCNEDIRSNFNTYSSDLISSNNINLVDNSVNTNASNDKKSISSVSNDIESKFKSCEIITTSARNVEIKIEETNDNNSVVIKEEEEMELEVQSDLSVINKKSFKFIVPKITVETVEKIIKLKDKSVSEKETKVQLHDSNSNELNLVESYSNSNTEIHTYSDNDSIVELCNSGMNFYFGRNLWSDLSLFDALTHQPIFLGHSILEWSDLNTYSSLIPYYATNQTRLVNTYLDYANNLRNSTVTKPKNEIIKLSSKTGLNFENEVVEKTTDEITCEFCFKYYNSPSCLFYTTHGSNTPLSSTTFCLCCDADEEDDDQEDQDEELGSDKPSTKVLNVNPGWFGKGYRKKIKKRK